MSFTLESIVKRKEAFPDSFFIPTEEQRQNLSEGALVKLFFNLKNNVTGEVSTERMWVQLTEVHDNDPRSSPLKYVGVLDNTPNLKETAVKAGDRINFGPEHVALIYGVDLPGTENELVPHFSPPLITILASVEKTKGAPLTEEEVLAIRDKSVVIMVPRSAKRAAEERLEYRDIDPVHCWAQWSAIREQLQ